MDAGSPTAAQPVGLGSSPEAEDGHVKRALLKLMPGRQRQMLLGALRSVRYRGDLVECPCCDSTFSRFLPHRGRPYAKCPGCGALERHRLLLLFLERETDLFEHPGSMLHIAPEHGLRRRLSRTRGLLYVTGDLDPGQAELELDVTDLPFDGESFDFLLCNHVLEHVEDDRRALAEIYRVVRPGGWAILMSPVDHRRAITLEDPAVREAGDRHRVFGQSDHVRLYGRDYPNRLAEAGFTVRMNHYLESFDEPVVRRLGLRREADEEFGVEEVYLCVKPRR